MSIKRPLIIGSVLALAALLASCSTNAAAPGSTAPTPSPTPSLADEWTAPPPSLDKVSAVWLAGGTSLGIVTWGSGSTACYPVVEEVTVADQAVTVTLGGPTVDGACMQNYTEQLILVGLPEGVDSTAEATVTVKTAEESAEIALAARPADATSAPAGEMSATLTSLGVVLVSYGSSSCPPVVDTVDGRTVTFRSIERACTMDYAPRATLLAVEGAAVGEQLTLVGLDGATEPATITVQN